MTAWVDGAFVAPAAVPPPAPGAIAPFETMGAQDGRLPLWDRHLLRLAAAAARLGLPFAAPPTLRAAAAELLLQHGDPQAVLRLLLVPRPGGAVHTVLTARPRGPSAAVVKLLPTVVARRPDDPPGDLKAQPRRYYDAVRQQAQDGGADDGVVVAQDGAVLETAIANLWLQLDGTWVTPALDGRVLPGIARAVLLAEARRAGVPVAERRVDLADLHRAAALAVSNAVHGPRPAVLLAVREPRPAGDAAALVALWRSATAG